MIIKPVLCTVAHRTLVLIVGSIMFLWGIMLFFGVLPARAGTEMTKDYTETVYQADIAGRMNPDGIMLSLGGFRRWSGALDLEYGIPSSYHQLGLSLGVNPAYAQASLYYEWKPAIFAQVRLQYDLYRFFGDHGALLSFPSADAKFGKHEIDTLSGQEETGWGHRVMLQPIITAKTGPVIYRNTTDLAYYRFDGRGPYFLESEYDTLLKNNDYLLNNRAAILLEAWKGSGAQTLLVGPFYEITYGSRAEITRQRAGIHTIWSPADSIGFFKRPRVYAQIGRNLQDRNRDNEAFFTAGAGFDF